MTSAEPHGSLRRHWTRFVSVLEIATYCFSIASIPVVATHWDEFDGVAKFMFVSWWIAAPLLLASVWLDRRGRR